MDPQDQNLDALRKRWDKGIKRSCNGCTACCDHFEIEEINKASKEMCPLKALFGCSVHATADMPRVCSTYACAWSIGYGKLSDRPDKSGVIVDFRNGLAGDGLYGHLIQTPTEDTLETMNRISDEAGLDVYLESKKE